MTKQDKISIRWSSSVIYKVLHFESLELVTILVENFNMNFDDYGLVLVKDIDILKYCMEKSNLSEKQKNDIFIRACDDGSIAIIRYLIEEQKVDIYQRHDCGKDAMWHVMFWNNNIDTVKCLYDLGYKDLTRLGPDNETCLHYACDSDHFNLETIKFFIDNGADLHAKTLNENLYPIDKTWEHTFEIVCFLMDLGSPMMLTDSFNHLITFTSLENVKKFDEKYKVDWSCRDRSDDTALQYFIKNGEDLNVFKYVVEHSNVECRSKEGLTVRSTLGIAI